MSRAYEYVRKEFCTTVCHIAKQFSSGIKVFKEGLFLFRYSYIHDLCIASYSIHYILFINRGRHGVKVTYKIR